MFCLIARLKPQMDSYHYDIASNRLWSLCKAHLIEFVSLFLTVLSELSPQQFQIVSVSQFVFLKVLQLCVLL